MEFTLPINLPAAISTPRLAVEAGEAAQRAMKALSAAIAEPGKAQHRVDITNALNYLETIIRQEGARA